MGGWGPGWEQFHWRTGTSSRHLIRAGVTQPQRSARVCSRVAVGIPANSPALQSLPAGGGGMWCLHPPGSSRHRHPKTPGLRKGSVGGGNHGMLAPSLSSPAGCRAVPCHAVLHQPCLAVPAGHRDAALMPLGSPKQTQPLADGIPQLSKHPSGLSPISGCSSTGPGCCGGCSLARLWPWPGCNRSAGRCECLCRERGASAGGSLEKSSVLGTWAPAPRKTAAFWRHFPSS